MTYLALLRGLFLHEKVIGAVLIVYALYVRLLRNDSLSRELYLKRYASILVAAEITRERMPALRSRQIYIFFSLKIVTVGEELDVI